MDLPLGPALAFHRDQGALATLLLYPQKAPYRYLPVQIDEEGNLHRFKNGPVAQGALRPEIYVFTGVHILEPEVFDFIPSGFFFQINDQVYPAALRSGKRVLAFPVEGYWNDIGDPARYLIAQREFFLRSSRDPFLCISPEASVETGSVVGPYVSAEAGCVVETDSLVANAIFWEGVRLKRGSAVRNCIAGSGMTIEGQYANCIVTRNGEARLDLD
jgi:NDP-sugar pyrophosphorylase family protein